MFMQIDPYNGIAIYDQVVRQVKFAIAQGVLKPGSRIPSVRDVAKELALNPNTVARAYQQMQADGVLETVRGLGMEVTPAAVKHCRAERQRLIQARLRQALVEAQHSGLTGDDLRQLVETELSAVLRERS